MPDAFNPLHIHQAEWLWMLRRQIDGESVRDGQINQSEEAERECWIQRVATELNNSRRHYNLQSPAKGQWI